MSAARLSQVVEIADKLFPFETAEDWDNCGIQIGNPDRQITAVAFSLDPTPRTVEFARDNSCELLITHHPVLTEPILRILPDRLPGRTLLTAARMGIDILSLHTNLDAAPGGLNDRLASLLDLQEVFTPLPARCARMGRLVHPMTIDRLGQKICQDLGISHVRVVSAMECEIQTVFSASGSGMGYLGDALNYKADVLVTGDVRYHAALEALELGMPVIDAGHYGTEKVAISVLLECFQTEFEREHLQISCIACNFEDDPFVEIYT